MKVEINPFRWFAPKAEERPVAEKPVAVYPQYLAADAPVVIDARGAQDAQAVRDAIGARFTGPVMSVTPQFPQTTFKEQHMSFLDHAGHILRKLLHLGEEAAMIAEPIIAISFPDIVPLYNSAIGLALVAQGTAAKATGTGPQKLSNVISQLLPIANEFLTKNNISMDQAALTKWASAVVDTLNLIPAPQAATAQLPVPLTPPPMTV